MTRSLHSDTVYLAGRDWLGIATLAVAVFGGVWHQSMKVEVLRAQQEITERRLMLVESELYSLGKIASRLDAKLGE